MKPSYVGVASITGLGDALFLQSSVPKRENRVVAVGVGVSHKTLDKLTTRHSNRYIDPHSRLQYIFPERGTLNLVHYNFEDLNRVGLDLDKVVQLTPYLGGIQINQPREGEMHNCVSHLANFHERYRYKDFRIILQIRPDVFKARRDLINWLAPYYPYITDILLDMSLGLGRVLSEGDINYYLKTLRGIHREFRKLGLGVAGGLLDDNLHILTPLFNEFPNLNIDAEGRLRDEYDDLDLLKAARYVINAFAMTK